jgi:hypothetical protein
MKYAKYLILFIFTNITVAQTGGVFSYADARSVAMGSQTALSATGVFSILSNPANLALQKDKVELSTVLPIPGVNAVYANDFLSFNDMNYYFGGVPGKNGELEGRYLNAQEKAELLSKFNDGNYINIGSTINLFMFTVNAGKDLGTIGFAINDILGQKTGLPKDLFELLLNGNQLGKKYNLNDMVLSTTYLREYNLSYARDFSSLFNGFFDSFSAGITLKLVHGYAYSEIAVAGTTIEMLDDHSIKISNNFLANIAVSPDFGVEWEFDEIKRVSNISPFLSPAGSGFGFNIGFSAELDSLWAFGLSITDIGSVTWDNNPVSYKANGTFTISDVTDSTLGDSLENALKPVGSYTQPFTSDLPTVLRFATSFRLDKFLHGNFPGEMLIVLGYNQGFNNSISNTTSPMISVGCEWKPAEIIPIRTGIAVGGYTGFAWSFGIGLNTSLVELNFATADVVSSLQGNDAKIIQFTIDSRWKF